MLPLAFKPGEDFFVDHQRFVINEIIGPTEYRITREQDGKTFLIVDDGKGHEIMPLVRVTVGTRGQGNLARLAFSAPKSIRILRGENYRAAGGNKSL